MQPTRVIGGLQTGSEKLSDNFVVRVGFYAVLAFVYCYISRVLDITVYWLRIPLILAFVYASAAALSMRFPAFLRFPAGKAMTAFFGWMLLAFPFSIWRGGSVETVMDTIRGMMILIGIVALVTTVDHASKIAHTIGYAVLTSALISFKAGTEVTGRLILDQGILADPNALAGMLLVGIPFLLGRASNSDNMFVKAALYVSILPVLVAVGRTGSRGGLVTAAFMTVVLFLRASIQGKVALGAAAAVVAVMLPFVIPDRIMDRYTTLFESDNQDWDSAAGSAKARSHLFRRSIELTVQNPILGVGPGMFAVAENDEWRAKHGVRGAWHTTHNTYTQVSSENGIPALIFYAFALVASWLGVRKILKGIPENATGERKRARNTALAIELGLASFAMSGMTLSLAYMGVPFILMGLCMAFSVAAAPLLAVKPATVPAERRFPAGLRWPVPAGKRPAAAPLSLNRSKTGGRNAI